MTDILEGIFELIVVFARSWWMLAGFVVAVGMAYAVWQFFPESPYRQDAAILCFAVIFGGTLLGFWAKGEKP
ncbi:MAG TPA: hypothetical protein VF450_05875 [Noviherbaspirillum sp.]